jgi:hypothetical protein
MILADLNASIHWANQNNRRWAFTLSNAGSSYFEDRKNISQLNEINWVAVEARDWRGELKEGKQAEFLMEQSFPWHLVERIGVHSQPAYQRVLNALLDVGHRPRVEVLPMWYY